MAWQDRSYYREGSGGGGINLGFPPPSPMALCVMGGCFLVFVLQAFTQGEVAEWGDLTLRGGVAFTQPWRWITYQYLHGSPSHIFWNILWIYFFLPPLERLWGWRRALAFYTLGGIAAGVAYAVLSRFFGMTPLIGASGSIMACVGACALLFPEMSLFLLVISIPIRVVAVLYALYYALTVIGSHNLADAAHLGGLVFGVLGPYYGGPAWRKIQRRMHLARARAALEQERADDELVDRILQKVHDTGMQSLTRWERRALKRATERQRVAEMARGRRGM